MIKLPTTPKTRVYLVTVPNAEPRLVEATSKSTALRFVAEQLFGASIATQSDLIAALSKGTVIEKAGEEPAAAPALSAVAG